MVVLSRLILLSFQVSLYGSYNPAGVQHRKLQDTRYNSPNNFQYTISNYYIVDYWSFEFEICLFLVSWLLEFPCYTRTVWTLPVSLATTQGISLISFPPGTKMFQFPGLPPAQSAGYRISPFGNLRIKGLLAPHRSLSQPYTSFIGILCLGIHHTPLRNFILNLLKTGSIEVESNSFQAGITIKETFKPDLFLD